MKGRVIEKKYRGICPIDDMSWRVYQNIREYAAEL